MKIESLKEQIFDVFLVSGWVMIELLPYILIGVLLGEVLKLTTWTKLIYRVCRNHPRLSILLSSLLGIISPLCTYGTIPVVIQLYRANTPLAPLISFLCTSSLMNPQLFILTWGGINPEMAVIRLIAVMAFGVLLGFSLQMIPAGSIINPQINNDDPSKSIPSCRTYKKLNIRELINNSWKTLQFIGFYMTIGIISGSLIQVFVPGRWIFNLLNPGEWIAVPLAALLGIPFYACGGGAIPLIRSLMISGMGNGPALAFFIVGPATRITPLLAMSTVVRPKSMVVYVIVLVVFSIIAGVAYR